MPPDCTYRPIGVIRSPFTQVEGSPIQPTAAAEAIGSIELDPAFAEGLADLDGFSHLILIYHLDRAKAPALKVKPFLDDVQHGIFATRAPTRPNPIGLSVVQLIKIEGSTLHLKGIDALDGTPLLDIKPYVPMFDSHPEARSGWFTGKETAARQQRADARFARED